MRTLLRAQPALGRRILASSTDLPRQRMLVISAAQRAGLAGIVDQIPPKQSGRATTPERTTHMKQQAKSNLSSSVGMVSSSSRGESGSSSGAAAATEKTSGSPQSDPSLPSVSRWRRRAQADTGWQRVEKKRPSEAPLQHRLKDEWTVPPTDMLRAGQAGIVYVRTRDELLHCGELMKGSPTPSAAITMSRYEPPEEAQWLIERIPFHTECTFQHNGTQKVQHTSRVGWMYCFNKRQPVKPKKTVQVTTTNAASSTVVVKVSVHKKFTPSEVWEQLQAGRIKALAEKLKADLLSQQEGFDCTGLQDTFQLQSTGRLCSALVRVKTNVLSQVLQVSGFTWLFVQPLGEEAEKYPVSWTPGGLPDSLKAAQERLKDTGALGLAIAERRIGYRATPISLAEVRVKLGQKETVAWRLAGAPLHASNADAQAWITEMKFDAELLPHTRRVRKGTQDWLLRAETTKSPQVDVLSLEQANP